MGSVNNVDKLLHSVMRNMIRNNSLSAPMRVMFRIFERPVIDIKIKKIIRIEHSPTKPFKSGTQVRSLVIA